MPKPLLAAFAVFLLLFGAVFGFMVGANKSEAQWKQTQASVSGQTASFEGPTWTAKIATSVPWFDADGTFHAGGWPACLTEHSTNGFIYVAPHGIDVDGHTVRPVYAVDCRH
ncbi:hypothetical protein [Nocardioides jejuensis]|uniref:Uncharacterized protein n=1 Tax=Nocardioides jejuensis TaxID=2502782 RepID=A0A4R1BWH5_9ACTN|nr:hypothetical protein [Nocardioides jejuensis]TCJ21917.1 hypothetical protein EPD65_14125 [Nocardioides jejuensis]